MANMKELLGDIDFEEFEVMRKTALEKLKEKDVKNFNELISEDTERLYRYWLELGGKELAHKWVDEHGGRVIIVQSDEFRKYIIKSFMGWLDGF